MFSCKGGKNMLFGTKKRYLIAGLGNPGHKYENTRHNVGFICADSLVEYFGAQPLSSKGNALIWCAKDRERDVYIIKPQTFMNLSGTAVSSVMHYYRIPLENLIVIYDDVSLDAGKIRIRPKGSDGGHNGIWDIIKNVNSEEFLRIKIGVGKKPHPEYDLKDWVLGQPSAEDMNKISKAAQKTGDICKMLMDGQLDSARNKYNG